MGYKVKFKQLSFTMLITKRGESLCSYACPQGTDSSRGARIENLTHCSFSVKVSKLAPNIGFLQSYIFSLSCVIVASLGKRIREGKFRVMFSLWCKVCHESCRDCPFTTVFISHQWTFPTHFCFTLFNPICTDGKTSRGSELLRSFSKYVKKSTSTLCV